MSRILENLFYLPFLASRACSDSDLKEITTAIRESEALHSCEIVFIVEGALDLKHLWRRMSVKDRALDLFSSHRVWDTETNNGILIYVLLAEHAVEIVCDRGVRAAITEATLSQVMAVILKQAQQKKLAGGVIEGIKILSTELAQAFPGGRENRNDLKDEAVRLR